MNASALVLAPSRIGDAVMAQPLLALLRQRDPRLRVDVLSAPHAAPVFRAMSEVAEVIESPAAAARGTWLRLAWALRRRDYRRAYVLPDAAAPLLPLIVAGIPERIGHRGTAHRLLLNRIHDKSASATLPHSEHFARLAFAPDDPPPGSVPAPRLARRGSHERAARARFDLASDAPLIALCPAAEPGPAGHWPARHFAALASLVRDRWPTAQVVVLGAARERALGTEIAALSGQPMRNLAGQTSIAEAIALLSQAAGVVSGDSGLMHVAAAFGRPQVAVFGASDPRRAPPRSPRAHVEWLHLPCSPCTGEQCTLGRPGCLDGLAPAAVFDRLQRAMSFEPASNRPAH